MDAVCHDSPAPSAAIQRPRNWHWPLVLACLVLALGLLGNVVAVANPGVFNHDEIQAYEEVDAWGVWGYARHYAGGLDAVDLGTPVRPIGRAIWGVQVAPFPSWPALAHLTSVLAHLLNALIVGLLVSSLLVGRARAAVRSASAAAALLFALSPLTSLGTAWSAASPDRTYTTFVLLCVCSALWWLRRAERDDAGRAGLLLIGFSALGASLSKETAIMLPAALAAWLLLFAAGRYVAVTWRRAAAVLGAAVVGLLPYGVIRILPGLLGSASGQQTSEAYDLQVNLVGQKAAWFFAFPFAPEVVELQNLVFETEARMALYVTAHLLLLVLVLVGLGWRHALAYMGLYFAFVAPILFVPNTNSHYLYGSAAGMSIMIALLLQARLRRVILPVVGILVVVLSYHHVQSQRGVYAMGECQDTFFTTLGAELAQVDPQLRLQPVAVVPDPGSPGYVAARTTLGTTRVGEFSELRLAYAPTAAEVPPEAGLVVRFDLACRAIAGAAGPAAQVGPAASSEVP